MRCRMKIFLAFAILIFSSSLRAQSIDYLGSTLWSGVNDVKISGNYAYCAFFNGLMILDISVPDTPTFVSQYYIGGDWFYFQLREGQRLAVSGNYVYFAADYEGLNIIDVSNPANPTLASQYLTPSYATDVFVLDTLAYLTCESSALEILNISDPHNPTLVAQCEIPGAVGVYVRGNYAYLASELLGLYIIDVSDPTNPIILGNYISGNYAVDVQVVGNYAYLAYGYYGLIIVDVTNPLNPSFVGSWSDYPNVWVDGLCINGNYAYLATDGHFLVMDISNPFQPSVLGSLSAGWNLDVFVSANYAYVAALTNGLHVINIADPANPSLAGTYATPNQINDVFISGNYAYVSCGPTGLKIVDITNSSNPITLGSWVPPYFNIFKAVYVSGSYAYLATHGDQDLWIVNISDPQNPTPVGNCILPQDAFDVYVREPYAYVADYSSGLYILNVSDPAHPSLAGNLETPYQIYGVNISGNYAYLAGYNSLHIVDVGDPAHPAFAGNWHDIFGYPYKVVISGNYAYLADGGNGGAGLQIINVSDPTNPTFVGYFQAHGSAVDVSILGNYAYLAESWTYWWGEGIEIVDISDPAHSSLADSLKTPGDGYGIAVSNGQIYLADYYSFMILHSDLTGIEDQVTLPNIFSLSQNYPNPFNAATTIKYDLPKSSDVSIDIFDILGRKVETLISGKQLAGSHSVIWDAKDVSSGIYFYKIQAGDFSDTKRCLLLK
jgi:hypothetical protein